MKNLILCGFMGSGKTTVGAELARRLSCSFVDLDNRIVQTAGMPITEIFRRFGEEGFREREHQAVLEASREKGLVLATGGGTLTFQRNVSPLAETGIIFYLNPGFEECYRRVAGSDIRPLVRSNDKGQLELMYRRRDPAYRQAAHHVIDGVLSEEETVHAILRLFQSGLNTPR